MVDQSTIIFDGGIMGSLSLAVLLLLHFSDVYGADPVIDLNPGKIYGTTFTSRNGRNISAFLGIPYAKPPVGKLRFTSTSLQPLEEIGDNIQAKVDGNQCPQLNDDGAVVGDEDCLYLNVYVPQTSNPQLLPTMVYFHGGRFIRGSGSSTDAGPEYLLDRDIVLVTLNYRLGVLGFLSTSNAIAPGNYGLKDQSVALQWVRQYIPLFGGTAPVTIFGQGAGGVSTSLHAMSEDGRQDLFDQYISQSGNAMAFWGFVPDMFRNYSQRAEDLGNYLNCGEMLKTIDLVDCLRNAEVQSLVDSNEIFGDNLRFDTWTPTRERPYVPDAFIREAPLIQTISLGILKDCPAILGNVHDEGLLFSAELYVNDTLYDTIVNDVEAFLYPLIDLLFVKSGEVTEAFRKLYFDESSPVDKELFIQNVTKFVTDMGFRSPTEFLSTIMSDQSQLYFYTFNYRGTYSKTSATIGNNDDIGVTHGDDLTYFFPMKNSDIELSESDEKMIDIMLDYWTSFATTGIPTSQNLDDPNVWAPFNCDKPRYLSIGNNGDPMDMQLYNEYDHRLITWEHYLWDELADFFQGLSLG